jgi:hypothetical protein
MLRSGQQVVFPSQTLELISSIARKFLVRNFVQPCIYQQSLALYITTSIVSKTTLFSTNSLKFVSSRYVQHLLPCVSYSRSMFYQQGLFKCSGEAPNTK